MPDKSDYLFLVSMVRKFIKETTTKIDGQK